MSLPPDGKNWMSDREWEQTQDDQVPDTWVCAWCASGQHAFCTMGLRCDCNAGRGDCWGHLPPKKLKLVLNSATLNDNTGASLNDGKGSKV